MKKAFLLCPLLCMMTFSACTSKNSRLSADTLTITIDPSTAQTLAPGSQLALKAICRSEKSDNVDISPAWSVENSLGSFSPAAGKTTTFTASATATGSGKIYATYQGIRGALDITVGTGGGGGVTTEKVFYVGGLAMGYNMDVDALANDSVTHLNSWLSESGGVMEMNYPAAQWGVVFIHLPDATPRPGEDLSAYTTLSFEIMGTSGGETVFVGLKDALDPDNGTETKLPITGITGGSWQTKTYSLASFTTCDLTKVYIPVEFAFGSTAAHVYVRNVKYY